MRFRIIFAAALGLIAGPAPLPAQSVTQSASYAEAPITVGDGGYTLNFTVQWTSDDHPGGTNSAPGRIDLVDGNGGIAGALTASLGGGSPVVSASGPGSVGNVSGELDQSGGGGTPANGSVSGTWTLTGLAAGAYTLRFWSFQEADPAFDASTIWTATSDAGGSGPINLPPAPAPAAPPDPTPDPSPAPAPDPSPSAPAPAPPSPPPPAAGPPGISIAAPGLVSQGQSAYVSALATAAPNGNPLQTVILQISYDGGATWSELAATPAATNPSDAVGNPVTFDQAGSVCLHAIVYDTAGLTGVADQTVTVAPVPVPVASAAPDPAASPPPAPPDPPPDPVPPTEPTAPGYSPPPAPAPVASIEPAPAASSVTPVPTPPAAANPASPPPAAPRPAGARVVSNGARTLRSDRATPAPGLLSAGPAP